MHKNKQSGSEIVPQQQVMVRSEKMWANESSLPFSVFLPSYHPLSLLSVQQICHHQLHCFNHHYGKVVTSIVTCPIQVHLEVVSYFQMKIPTLSGCEKKNHWSKRGLQLLLLLLFFYHFTIKANSVEVLTLIEASREIEKKRENSFGKRNEQFLWFI